MVTNSKTQDSLTCKPPEEACVTPSQTPATINVLTCLSKKENVNFLSKFYVLLTQLQNEVVLTCLKIYTTPHVLHRIFLFLFVMASCTLASFTVIQSVIGYFEYAVVTKSQLVYETQTQFPKVTICNLNPFTTEYAYEFLSRRTNSSWNIYENKAKFESLNYSEKVEFLRHFNLLSITKMNRVLSDEEKKKLSHSLEDIVFNCTYNQRNCDLKKDFTWTFDKFYGNCYVFNSNG
jgi:hypothetical protein